jgi:SAM-dependent methyltransferase
MTASNPAVSERALGTVAPPDGAAVSNEWQAAPMPGRAQAPLLRRYDETAGQAKLIGSTCFFRNRPLLRTLLEQIDAQADEINVLFHGSSIGAEAYSFSIAWQLFFQGRRQPRLKSFATDLSTAFLGTAKLGVYPLEILADMSAAERAFFERIDDSTCRVAASLHDAITFLPAASFVTFESAVKFDVVILLNGLVYVSAADQAASFDRISRYNTRYLLVTGYHANSIHDDLVRNHYLPLTDRFEEIYENWTCRRSLEPGVIIAGVTYYTPAMEPLRPCPDYHYRFGAIFKKQPVSPQPARLEAASVAPPQLSVALFNDTGKASHAGCHGVASGHDRMFSQLNVEVGHRFFLGEWAELWKGGRTASLEAFRASELPGLLAGVDAVIVNGEGTIHHGAGLHLLTILAGAQELGVPTLLVNAVFEECEEFTDVLRKLDDFTVRDLHSSRYLKSLGVPHRLVLDSIFEADFSEAPAHDFKGKIIVTDGIACRSDVVQALNQALGDFGDGAVYYPLESAERVKDWRHAVADFRQARLIVTGRHHGVCLASLAGTPFVAMGSNTWKVEGLLSLFPGNLELCTDAAQLRAHCEQALKNPGIYQAIREFVLRRLPLNTFEKLATLKSGSGKNSRPTAARAAAPRFEKTLDLPLAAIVPFAAAGLETWLDEHLTVCGEGRTLVAGPGAAGIVGKLIARGIEAWGVDTHWDAAATAYGEHCVAGTLAEIPWHRGPFNSAILFGAFDDLAEPVVRTALTVLQAQRIISLNIRVFQKNGNGGREWWEKLAFENGFRKHPARHLAQPYVSLDLEPLVMYFETLAPGASPLASGDPSRLSSRVADAMLARYELVSSLVRPWDTVLDLGCGCGYGTNVLRRTTRGGRFIGTDEEAAAIQYAEAHFATGITEFVPATPAEALSKMSEASIDFAICSTPLVNAGAVDGLVEVMEHILAPGGRLVMAVSGTTLDITGSFVRHRLAGGFLWEAAYRQSSHDGGVRSLAPVSAMALLTTSADAWIVVAMKDPLAKCAAPYHETAFRHVANGPQASVLNYPEFYQHPWILHSLVHAGTRLNVPEGLAQSAQRLVLDCPETSADAGAALCVLVYRAMDGKLPEEMTVAEIIHRAEGFLRVAEPNAHQFRWQVSIGYALGLLAMSQGDFSQARRRFAAVADLDVFRWGPSLATKTTEAIFLAGWLAWCANDLDDCRQWWKRGMDFGKQLLARPLDETLLNPKFPNLFDYGDGMRELIYALENVALCTNGLHGLQLREHGIAFRWDLIFNSFRIQRDQRDRHLRAAQGNVEQLCRDIDFVRAELRERTEALDATRAENARLQLTLKNWAATLRKEPKLN